jgi:hypothetical protein
MPTPPEFDLAAAHTFFAADCYNKTWEFMDKPTRTADDNQQMLLLSMASAWHWTQRADCTAENMSVAYWQISRVYVLLKQADNARRYGELSLLKAQAEGVAPWALGYAYEALARAEMLAGNTTPTSAHLADARRVAETLTDAEAKKMLLDDLATIV